MIIFQVEDYFITYFGEKDEVKEFQKKFLEKRIALRSKQKKDDKDVCFYIVTVTE